MKLKGKLTCTILPGHPDMKHIRDWEPDRKYTFEDTYTFSDGWSVDTAKEYIKTDLSLIAGGGYNDKYIANVAFKFERR